MDEFGACTSTMQNPTVELMSKVPGLMVSDTNDTAQVWIGICCRWPSSSAILMMYKIKQVVSIQREE